LAFHLIFVYKGLLEMTKAMKEPEFDEINGIDVVQPEMRFPIGQYIALGPKVGVLFPSVPFNKRGRPMRSALNTCEKMLFTLMNTNDAGIEAMLKKDTLELDHLWDEIQEAVMQLFKAALEINYLPETVEWIVENIMVDMGATRKMLLVARGEQVDADIFRGKQA